MGDFENVKITNSEFKDNSFYQGFIYDKNYLEDYIYQEDPYLSAYVGGMKDYLNSKTSSFKYFNISVNFNNFTDINRVKTITNRSLFEMKHKAMQIRNNRFINLNNHNAKLG